MWKIKRRIRLSEEAIEHLDETCNGLLNGVVPEELHLTPREKHEKRAHWSNIHRTKLRRDVREQILDSSHQEKEELLTSVKTLRKQLAKKRQLPPLHFELLRYADDSAYEYICKAKEGQDKILRNSSKREVSDCKRMIKMCNKPSMPFGWFPIHFAIQKNNMSALLALLKLTKVETKRNDGLPKEKLLQSFKRGVQSKDENSLENGMNINIDLDAKDQSGYTALHMAFMLERFEMARILIEAGADPTARNRENQNPFEVGLALGCREEVEAIAEEIEVEKFALLHAKRFFIEMFSGNPEYHHYKVKEYYNYLLVAYVLTYHPKIFSTSIFRGIWRFSPKLPNVDLFLVENIHEPDEIDLIDDFKKVEDASETKEDVEEEEIAKKKKPDILNKDKEMFTFEGFKIFRFVNLRRLKKYINSSKRWRFDSKKSCTLIARNIYKNSFTSEEIEEKFRIGIELFEKWKTDHKDVLKEDEERRIRAASDALRLKRMREEREKKLQEERARELAHQQDLERRGLANLDPNAGIKISFKEEEVDTVEYSADNTDPACYDIVLLTKPTGNVLIKLRIIKPKDLLDEAQFVTTPKVVSFTTKNWDIPQTVEIHARDDDAVVRLKRDVSQKPSGSCDHIIENSIQSTTDKNYKYAGLKWYPTGSITVHVVD